MINRIILILYIITTVSALMIVKLGTKSGLPVSYSDHKLHFYMNWYIAAGILLYGLSFATYVYLISKFDLGYIIPLAAAFVYILIFVCSAIIFKEAYTLTKVAGIALIIIGLVFLNLKR